MKIGDSVYTAYHYTDFISLWPKHRAAEGILIALNGEVAIVAGRRPTGLFNPQIIFKADPSSCFDNHYYRDKHFRY